MYATICDWLTRFLHISITTRQNFILRSSVYKLKWKRYNKSPKIHKRNMEKSIRHNIKHIELSCTQFLVRPQQQYKIDYLRSNTSNSDLWYFRKRWNACLCIYKFLIPPLNGISGIFISLYLPWNDLFPVNGRLKKGFGMINPLLTYFWVQYFYLSSEKFLKGKMKDFLYIQYWEGKKSFHAD